MSTTVTVEDWEHALALARTLGPEVDVVVPKAAEPTLPLDPDLDLDLRRSNVPWSVHRGALRVYREDVPGEHLQIREYADRWTVELDRYNPHYRPARHVAVDTREYAHHTATHPVTTTTGLLLFGPLRGLQLAGEVADTLISAVFGAVDRTTDLAADTATRLYAPSDSDESTGSTDYGSSDSTDATSDGAGS